ncbi:MAG: Zn-dependent hydrolase [Alphaproteobacteria bacterium]|nr:Zn-dependent hydrolase [Alphaproteobacteria bacterium]MCB9930762.1 Zn-dependent hydrolase [Alphaproteobacteria bacterium]
MEKATHDGVGITRASYGEGEQKTHAIMAEAAKSLGLGVAQDPACNSYFTLPGKNRRAPAVLIGSHLDSVAQGGNFDGAAGVVSGLTALAALKDAGITPACDVTVMGIRAEESAWFGVSYLGSRAALGMLPNGALEAKRSDNGRSLAEHIAECGGDPEALKGGPAILDTSLVRAFLEPHIEQGPVLDERETPIGIVTGIRGNRRLPAARCLGRYAHCGGEPRWNRQDAVIAVSEFVLALDGIWTEIEAAGSDFAFTVGKFSTDPDRHAMTIVNGEVRFSLDLRSLDPAFLLAMESRLEEIARSISARRGVRFDLGQITRAAPGRMDTILRNSLWQGVREKGLDAIEIASGAAHDSAAFAAAGVPTAMIFIRNANGSHNPDEAMRIEDFMVATDLLAWQLTRF